MRHRALIASVIFAASFGVFAQSYGLAFPAGARVVLPSANAAGLLQQCSRPTPQGASNFWEPSDAAINTLELKLVEYLESRTGTESPPRGVSYHRQYIGFVRNGTRLIYGNFYPGKGEVTAGERAQAAIICDGGSSNWGIVYDTASGRFSELAFNGVT